MEQAARRRTAQQADAECARAAAAPAWGLQVHYGQPHPELTRYVSGYHRYVLKLGPGQRISDVFFPGWINLRFTLDAEPWSLRLGRQRYDPVPPAALFGPTSHAGYVEAGTGVLIGAGITPLGWARLFGRDASRYADRITPAAQLLGTTASELMRQLRREAPAAVFDRWFMGLLEGSEPEAPELGIIMGLLDDPALVSVSDLEARAGLVGRELTRATRHAFGFTPKLLLRRARFMRAMFAVQAAAPGERGAVIARSGYFDRSHFVRDSRTFLDMPLSRFLALPKPLNEASARLRSQVLGAPAQALHRVPAQDEGKR